MVALRWLSAVLLLFGAASCDVVRGFGPDFTASGFSVRAASGHLVLTNESSAPIHYVALEEETSALVDLNFDPQEWPSVVPGGEQRIPYGELLGYQPGATQARVYWWTQEHYGQHIIVYLR